MPTVTEAQREAYASAPQTQLLNTLELWHTSWAGPLRLVLDSKNWTLTLEASAPRNPSTAVVFSRCAFRYVRASQDESNQIPRASLEIDNVNDILRAPLKLAIQSRSKIEVIERIYLADTPTAAEYVMYGLRMRVVDLSDTTARAEMAFHNFHGRRFPEQVYGRDDFQSLVA